jgi:hypothetical protein
MNKSTSKFPLDGRGKYQQIMVDAGYVEDSDYAEAAMKRQGYFCNTCEYFKPKFNSPTDYWCGKYLFPDRNYGCCNGWERKK